MVNAPDALVVGDGGVHRIRCLTLFVYVILHTARFRRASRVATVKVLSLEGVAAAHR